MNVNVIDSAEFDDYDPDTGEASTGWDRIEEPAGSPLWEGVRRYFAHAESVKEYALYDFTINGPLYMKVHHYWSGYSEYSITSTWDGITLEWDGRTAHFDHMAHFFRAVYEADLFYDGNAQ